MSHLWPPLPLIKVSCHIGAPGLRLTHHPVDAVTSVWGPGDQPLLRVRLTFPPLALSPGVLPTAVLIIMLWVPSRGSDGQPASVVHMVRQSNATGYFSPTSSQKNKAYVNNGIPLHPTQLLAVSGPFHYWGPVVDGQSLREAPARALRRALRVKADLLIGSSQDDGLISRAKAVKVGRGAGCGRASGSPARSWP